MASDEPIDVKDLRRSARYVAVAPIKANFGSAEVWINNLGERGFQVQHTMPLKLGMGAVLTFHHPRTAETLVFRARVVWSRLSSMQSAAGKFLYRSGVRVEQLDERTRESLQTFLREFARIDVESLTKKQRKLSELAQRRSHPRLRPLVVEQQVPSDEVVLVQQARKKLRGDAVESQKWFNRAKLNLSDADLLFLDREKIRNREELLAVWGYLERRVPLKNISRVFDSKT